MNMKYATMHVYHNHNKYSTYSIYIQVYLYYMASETVGGPRAAFHTDLGYHDIINVTRRIFLVHRWGHIDIFLISMR